MGKFKPVVFSLLMLLLIAVYTSCRDKNYNTNSPATQKPVNVSGIVVMPKEIENKIYTTGSILANEEVEIRSEVSGRVVKINFTEGGFVNKGDLLIKINDVDLQAQLKKLLIEESLSKEDVYRKTKLLELAAISQEEMDIAKNQLGVIQADIELVRSQIAKTEIFAPFGGQIGLRYLSPGGFATPSILIARLMEVDPVKIEFAVPEKYLGKIQNGSTIFFRTDSYDSTFRGIVYAVDPKIDPSTRSLSIRARCQNKEKLIFPGSFAKVEIVIEKLTDALIIPSQAIIPDIRGEKVYVRENGMVKIVYVTTGIRGEREVQVSSGLQPGDTVITTGLLQLRENMKVDVGVKSL